MNAFFTALTTYGPWVVTIASTLAAAIPASAVNANPALKTVTAIIDLLAMNIGHAKEGPTPAAVMAEVATGEPSAQRNQVDKT